MKVTVAGSGYESFVISACLAEMGNIITHYSQTPPSSVHNMSFHEPGLPAMLESNTSARRLSFTADIGQASDCDLCILALGHTDAVDEQAVAFAAQFGDALKTPSILVNSSPTSLGVTESMLQAAQSSGSTVSIVCYPVFLKEGEGVEDFMRPDRIILGTENYEVRSTMVSLLRPFSRQKDRVTPMSVRDAELTRLAASAMLATRISLMNEIAAIAESFGADIEAVRSGIGADSRIGYSYLYPGVGYGGVCLPGDIKELINEASAKNIEPVLLNAVMQRNSMQQNWAISSLIDCLGDLRGKQIAIWGLAFRPETADVSGSAAIVLIRQLLDAGATIAAYDPMAMESASQALGNQPGVTFCNHQYDALTESDALVLMTEWKPFRQPDFNAIGKLLKEQVIIDGRNQYDAAALKQAGFTYRGVGRGNRE